MFLSGADNYPQFLKIWCKLAKPFRSYKLLTNFKILIGPQFEYERLQSSHLRGHWLVTTIIIYSYLIICEIFFEIFQVVLIR